MVLAVYRTLLASTIRYFFGRARIRNDKGEGQKEKHDSGAHVFWGSVFAPESILIVRRGAHTRRFFIPGPDPGLYTAEKRKPYAGWSELKRPQTERWKICRYQRTKRNEKAFIRSRRWSWKITIFSYPNKIRLHSFSPLVSLESIAHAGSFLLTRPFRSWPFPFPTNAVLKTRHSLPLWFPILRRLRPTEVVVTVFRSLL